MNPRHPEPQSGALPTELYPPSVRRAGLRGVGITRSAVPSQDGPLFQNRAAGDRTETPRSCGTGLQAPEPDRATETEQPEANSAPEEQRARPAGIEPATHGLEGRCSIQLSYGCIQVGVTGFEPATYGSQNRRATRLRYTPRRGRLTHRRSIAQARLWFQDLCRPLACLCGPRAVAGSRAELLQVQ